MARGIARTRVSSRVGVDGGPAQPELGRSCRFFLRRGIPTALVHYRAVVALKAALPLVEDLVSTPTFMENKKLSEQWKAFLGCISDNMVALEDFGQSFVAYKACDNTECGNMNEASSMAGRCSSCQAFYYCSSECQRIDWKTRHRSFCSEHKQLLLTARSSELEHRERWYIRALVHQRYIKYRRTICAKQNKVLASCDSRCILFTLFDHVLSRSIKLIRPLRRSLNQSCHPNRCWTRTARNGRIWCRVWIPRQIGGFTSCMGYASLTTMAGTFSLYPSERIARRCMRPWLDLQSVCVLAS
ncbi:hypothetical protein FB45DRAFT_447403 [Roridomyces roridus]|uniref:MYND-type domain-containing protein n=1 Tax=Roridomyces roridus TaxID=1738132 RepID=A0AAD7C1M0_9AGAR|nr:hypothetical protein FB45DRAFT_447403 [Roridomyces roridus]